MTGSDRIVAQALRRAAEIDPVAWQVPYVSRLQKRRNASYRQAEIEITTAIKWQAEPFIPEDYDGPTAATLYPREFPDDSEIEF